MEFPIALQLYSIRDEMANDFYGTLKKVKEMGYDGVEFAGLFGKTADEVKSYCQEIDLTPISAHIPLDELLNNPSAIDIYSQIGCEYVVIPYLIDKYRPGREGFDDFIEGAKVLAARANSLGMKLAYHNHDFEFEKIDGKYELDIIYDILSADLLETELDTCWVNVGGENPVDYINKYADRVNILHLKDFAGSKSENMYALIGIDEDEKKEQPTQFEFRPLGKGVQDFPAILAAAKQVGTQWIVVEQDNPSMNLSPLECAKVSIDYLKKEI